MICDVHAHYIPQKFGDFMGDRSPALCAVKPGIARHPFSDSPADIDGRLRTDGRRRGRAADPVAAPPALSARRGRGRAAPSTCSTTAMPSWRPAIPTASRPM